VGRVGLAFDPEGLTINAGDTVRWVWASSGHNVVSGAACTPDDLFCSPDDTSCATADTLPSGTTYEHVFGAPGTFPYFCSPHCEFGMAGTITVE